jgi:soluble lytic murein transglycosylase-like protein
MPASAIKRIGAVVFAGLLSGPTWAQTLPELSPPAPSCVIEDDISGDDAKTLIEIIAEEEQFDASLLLAIAKQESGYKMSAISRAGAIGLMQLMPRTAKSYGVNPCDPIENVRGAIKFLRDLDAKYAGNPIFVLAAYNAGETVVDDNSGLPPYPETLDYVTKVLSQLQGWKLPERKRGRTAAATEPPTEKAAPDQWSQGFVLHVE